MGALLEIEGRVVRGHGVASGRAPDSPYPRGTIDIQAPLFAAAGIRLDGLFRGTLNLDINPWRVEIRAPRHSVTLNWYRDLTERFSFCDAVLVYRGQRFQGLVYYPHPETKPAHHQPDTVLEVLAPPIPDLVPGATLQLILDAGQVRLRRLDSADQALEDAKAGDIGADVGAQRHQNE